MQIVETSEIDSSTTLMKGTSTWQEASGGMGEMEKARYGKAAKLQRLFEIVRIFNGGTAVDTKSLATVLGVSRRTVFRDLQSLRDAGYPLDFDESENRYRLFGDYQLHKRLDAQEIFDVAVGLAYLKLRQSMGRSWEISRQLIAKQLDAHRIEFMNECLEMIQFETEDTSGLATTSEEKNWLILLAVSRFDRLKVRLHLEGGTSTAFSPYSLTASEHGWLAVGRSSLHRHVREIPLVEVTRIDASVGEYELPKRAYKKLFRRVKYVPPKKNGKPQKCSRPKQPR